MHRVWVAIMVASLGWGTAGAATRAALDEGVTPYRLVAYRATLTVVIVLAYLAVRRQNLPRGWLTWKVGLVMGSTNLALPFLLSTLALQYAGAGFVGLMTALIPLVTAAAAHVAPLDEHLTMVKAVGLLIGFGGVAVLLLSGDSGLAEGGRPVLAGMLSLVAIISISVVGLSAKYHAGDYDPIDATGLQHAVGAVLVATAMLVVEGGPRQETFRAWTLLGYMSVVSSFIPMMLYYWLLRQVTATYASLAGYVVPVIAIVAGVVFLGEELQAGIVLGGLLIFLGVLVTDRVERRPMPAAPVIASENT